MKKYKLLSYALAYTFFGLLGLTIFMGIAYGVTTQIGSYNTTIQPSLGQQKIYGSLEIAGTVVIIGSLVIEAIWLFLERRNARKVR